MLDSATKSGREYNSIVASRPFHRVVSDGNQVRQAGRISKRDASASLSSSVYPCECSPSLVLIAFPSKTGIDRFCQDIKAMTGFCPGIYWRVCWKFIAPIFLMVLYRHFIDRYSLNAIRRYVRYVVHVVDDFLHPLSVSRPPPGLSLDP